MIRLLFILRRVADGLQELTKLSDLFQPFYIQKWAEFQQRKLHIS